MKAISHELKTTLLGTAGVVATLNLETVNAALGTLAGVLTIAGLVPLVLSRWKRYLHGDKP